LNFLQQLNRSLPTTIFLNVVFVSLWLLSAFWFETEKNSAEITIFNSISLFSLPYFWGVIAQLICFVMLALFVYKVIFLQYLSSITYLSFSVFMLFGVLFLELHLFGNQTFATIFFVLALWQGSKTDTRQDNKLVLLNTFLLLILSVSFVPEFIYFTPIFIFGFFYFIEFNIKSLMVIIFSISMPILCALGLCFLFDRIDVFNNFFNELFDLKFEINRAIFKIDSTIPEVISLILTLISLFILLRQMKIYKMYVRRFTFFCLILWLSTIFFIVFLQNDILYFIWVYIILTTFFITLSFNNLQPKRRKKVKLKKRRKFKKLRVKN